MNKILIIDDYKWGRLILAEELTDEGYQVVKTGESSQAMALIKQELPDLIIMESVLPVLDGLDLLQIIRKKYYDLPVILWTSYCSSRHDLRSMAADYCVIKSSDLSELKQKITMVLENSRYYPFNPYRLCPVEARAENPL